MSRDRADGLVADVAHCGDELLVLRAEFGPQPPDMDVDRAGAAEEVIAPHLLSCSDCARVNTRPACCARYFSSSNSL